MRDYEAVIAFSPDANDGVIGEITKKLEKIITAKPGKIIKKDDWGVKKLAYPIEAKQRARYVYYAFSQKPDTIKKFERVLLLDENVLRFMTYLAPACGVEASEKKVRKEEAPQEERGRGRRRNNRYSKEFFDQLNFKNPDLLGQFITEQGRIVPRRMSGFNALQQRQLAMQIKRARQLGLISYTSGYRAESRG